MLVLRYYVQQNPNIQREIDNEMRLWYKFIYLYKHT